MKTTLIFGIIGLLILTSWKYESSNELKKLEWLIGTWINRTSKGDIYETWTRKSSNELSGKSYYLKSKDTVLLESVRLVKREKKTVLYSKCARPK